MSALPFVYLIIGLLGSSVAVLVILAILDARPEPIPAPKSEPTPAFWTQLLGYRQRRRSQPQRAARQLNGAPAQARLA